VVDVDGKATIVAIRMRRLGDVLVTLGALEAIKERWPARRIVYVVDAHFHALLQGVGFIDELVPSPPDGLGDFWRYLAALRAKRPAAVLDFHGNPRSALVTALSGAPVRVGFDVRVRRRAYTIVEPRRAGPAKRNSLESALALARHVGAEDADGRVPPQIPLDTAALERARGRLVAAGVPTRALEAGTVVGVNPGKPYPAKEWPPERFVALCRRLVESRRHVVVMWGPGEEPLARGIAEGAGDGVVLAPPSRLDEIAGVVRALSLIVTIDSGLKHLAVCLRVPTVTLFGSTDPREWHVGTERDRYLWRGLSCSPCRRSTCPFDAPCMDIPVSEVERVLGAVGGR
jgi:ADP-heptose:LPS heptosyltransferase